MRTCLKTCVTIALAALAAACAPDGFSLDQTIDHPRVIAIASTPADLLPGEEVTFTAVTAGDLDGASTHAWELCAQTLGPDTHFACDPEAGGAQDLSHLSAVSAEGS